MNIGEEGQILSKIQIEYIKLIIFNNPFYNLFYNKEENIILI